MWNDLMRRWMELALWWVPGQRNDQKPASQEAAEQEKAPPRAPETPAQAPAAEAEPEAREPAPQPAPAAEASGDLKGIKGIGPAMQKRLATQGIATRADLATADPDKLTEALKADRAVISRAQVARWIEAAQA
ncbi:helix-hairpin-helix domain-containing protein [Spiribacter insolitus]|uniref:Helix-hairpin-helix domain-containing protein n=1 Tax=Spiribacter insolitus TaxID=3122417 RepID=A0ABV3T5X5_9GAMM